MVGGCSAAAWPCKCSLLKYERVLQGQESWQYLCPAFKHEAGLGNAFLWFSKQTQALRVRSEETEAAVSPEDCWQSGGTCWCTWACPCLPQVDPEDLTPSHKAGRHPKCIVCLWLPRHPATIVSLLVVEGFSPVVCWMPPSAWFLAICSLEWGLKGFSPLWHIRAFKGLPRACRRQACGAGIRKDRLGFQYESPPIPAARLWDAWGSPGPSIPSVLSVPHSPAQHQHGPQPCREQPALPCLWSLANGHGQGLH